MAESAGTASCKKANGATTRIGKAACFDRASEANKPEENRGVSPRRTPPNDCFMEQR